MLKRQYTYDEIKSLARFDVRKQLRRLVDSKMETVFNIGDVVFFDDHSRIIFSIDSNGCMVKWMNAAIRPSVSGRGTKMFDDTEYLFLHVNKSERSIDHRMTRGERPQLFRLKKDLCREFKSGEFTIKPRMMPYTVRQAEAGDSVTHRAGMVFALISGHESVSLVTFDRSNEVDIEFKYPDTPSIYRDDLWEEMEVGEWDIISL